MEEASQAAKDMFKGTAEELYRPDAGDILLAPSDYGSKRYCANITMPSLVSLYFFAWISRRSSSPSARIVCR